MKKNEGSGVSFFIAGILVIQILSQGSGKAQPVQSADEITKEAIRPFQIHFPESALADLKRRVLATRWPEKENVSDQSQGVPLATVMALANYWV